MALTMATQGFALFDTAIGRCGITWRSRGVVGVQLPEATVRETKARILRRFSGVREEVPPVSVRRAIEGIAAVLRGEPRGLGDVELDMECVPPFHRRVYQLTRRIAPGTTVSYGQIAARLGAPGAARAVGQALGKNPFAIIVPCHRVLAASGKPCGFSAHGGVKTKVRLLLIESASA
jgi:methylated-DNA-[protein]-cysteine S-methyltransferase